MGCCLSTPIDFDGDVDLFHFELHRPVGKGAFGKVRVIEHKKTHVLYALKYIDKSRCIKQKAVSNVLQERRLLEEIDHPSIVNLRYAFQDDKNCFFVLDLMLGGDLRFHLDRTSHLKEDVIKHWVAQLCSGLEYLHGQRIIHRDIKPDNVMLDSKGHAHITDFNVAIHYSERRQHTSVAGSMAYMAPQVVGRKGYSWEVDWWSLGVTVYELFFHRRPFDGRSSKEMTQSILKDSLRFPSSASERCSDDGLRAIKAFIERDPTKRLGCRDRPRGTGMVDVKEHPWFRSIDWNTISDKERLAPFVPEEKGINFDVSHELDEFLMVEKPLTHSKRRVDLDHLEKLSPERRQFEEQFTIYDFTKPGRNSYYPHNQPITTRTVESDERTLSHSHSQASETIQPTATVIERSLAGTPMQETVHNPISPTSTRHSQL